MLGMADNYVAFRIARNKVFVDLPLTLIVEGRVIPQPRWGKRWQVAMGELNNESINRLLQAKAARYPSFAPSDGLPYIGNERGIERLFNETEGEYRRVLQQAWLLWQKGGSNAGHQANLGDRAKFGVITIRRRKEFSPGADPRPYVNAFVRDVWAQFDVFITRPQLWNLRRWGDGRWGEQVWGFTATQAQLEQVKRLLRTFRAGHNTPTYLFIDWGQGQRWGLGVWGTGTWAGSGVLVKILVGEEHWAQRGLL